MQRLSYRAAFTLIEVLVVVLVIGVLIALLLPSVQHARHSAIRTQCQVNLRQIGIACAGYYDQYQSFPSGLVTAGGSTKLLAEQQWYLSWMARILPFIEQEGLSSRIRAEYARSYDPWGYAADGQFRPHEALGQEMPLYYCSAEQRALLNPRVDFGRGFVTAVGLTCYLGNSGVRCGANNGMLYANSAVTTEMIKDGTSNTILVGERPPSADMIFGWWYAGAGYYDPQYGQVGVGDVIMGVREAGYAAATWSTGAVCSVSKIQFQPGTIEDPCDQLHFWSYHPGGSNFLFADGSVHFLAYTADRLLPALSTRAGREYVEIID